jgi:hypothetical protein
MKIDRTNTGMVAVLMILAISGCDERAARIAEEGAKRQAEQNQSMARLQEHVAQGTKRLTEEEAEARKQALVVHEQLQHERAELNGGWSELESERKAIDDSRRTESFLAALVKGGGATLIGVLALAFAWLALYGLTKEDSNAAVCQLVVEQLTSIGPIEVPPYQLLQSGTEELSVDGDALPTTPNKEPS